MEKTLKGSFIAKHDNFVIGNEFETDLKSFKSCHGLLGMYQGRDFYFLKS